MTPKCLLFSYSFEYLPKSEISAVITVCLRQFSNKNSMKSFQIIAHL